MRLAVETQTQRGPKARGFTLLELVILIAVLTALAGVAIDLLMNANDKTAFRVTVGRMDTIRAALQKYSEDTVQFRVGDGSQPDTSLGILDSGLFSIPGFLNQIRIESPLHDSGGGTNGPYLPFTSGSPDNRVAIDDVYFDGWGTPIYYLGPVTGDSSANQAIAYLVSAGPDRELNYSYGAAAASAGDDLVYEINATSIFHEEARRRVEAINMAIAKYIQDGGAALNNTAYFANSDNTCIFTRLLTGGTNPPYLPDEARYKWSPWLTNPVSNFGAAVPTSPVKQVDYVWPAYVGSTP